MKILKEVGIPEIQRGLMEAMCKRSHILEFYANYFFITTTTKSIRQLVI